MADAIDIVTYIFTVFTVLISFYLLFLYLISKEFHKIQCYNIIIISIIVFVDNTLRIIPMDIYILRHIQAFLLTFLDNLLLTTITCQALTLYFGVCHTKLYYKREKIIFIISSLIGLLTSIILTTLFMIIGNSEKGEGGITNYDNESIYFYVIDTDFKTIVDSIFYGIFLLFNIFFSIILLIFITKKKKKASIGIIEDLDYGHHKIKIVLMFLINSFMFVEAYLITYDKLPDDFIELIYLISCFLVDLYYTINKIIIKETMKIFCKDLYNKKYPQIKKRGTIDIGVADDDDDDED